MDNLKETTIPSLFGGTPVDRDEVAQFTEGASRIPKMRIIGQ